MVFVSAKSGPPNIGDPPSMFTVQYFDEQGNMIIRSGGKRTWRCNNPGALLKSPYSMSKDRRAIGSAGFGEYEYAVYPDYEIGRAGLPSDQASMALFLATEESSWMTGQILTVDGGHSIALSIAKDS